MSDLIQLLPDAVANQIAAGEVIQRPASVLKELVENAIDAGATSIQVIIKDAGRTLLQVVDNGKGMSETDARMAFERHATSKIRDAADLFSIRTMGFRGEALASIAAVAQVEMRTRTEDSELGTLVEIAGSQVFRQEPVQCERGTTFLVKNLFFNVPARRRFLKSDNVEKTHLLNEFYRIVLVNPELEFALYDNDEPIFQLSPANTRVRIDQVFGSNKKKLNQQLLGIETNTGLVDIRGFVGRPEYAQKNAHQYFFVNGRYMRHPYFHKAVMLAYNQLIQANETPQYFIYLEVDPQSIDINIHPTKSEIKFENEQAIWSILSAAVKEALGKFNIVPSIDFDREGVPDMPFPTSQTVVRPPKTEFNPGYNPFTSTSYKRPALEWEKLYQGFEKPEEQPVITGIDEDQVPEKSAQQPDLDRSGATMYLQLKNRYILTSVKSGLLLIDQRRAHIRILFDQFLNEIQRKQGVSQQLLFPEQLHLSVGDRPFFEQLKQQLYYVGFDFEKQSDDSYMLKGIPSQLKATDDLMSLLQDVIERTRQSTGDGIAVMEEQIARSLAMKAAIDAGQKLSNEEMSELVERLFVCSNHNYSPDGKVILSILTQEEIQNRFA